MNLYLVTRFVAGDTFISNVAAKSYKAIEEYFETTIVNIKLVEENIIIIK